MLSDQRNADSFNINSCSSNGNTALHWACAKAIEARPYSEEYAETIRLLIKYASNPFLANSSGQRERPCDYIERELAGKRSDKRFWLFRINKYAIKNKPREDNSSIGGT